MKKTIVILITLSLLLAAAGCGGKEETAPMDGAALTRSLLSSGCFSVKLEELPASKAQVFYGVDGSRLQNAWLYHAEGVCKEQIAVFQAVDETAAGEIVPILREMLENDIRADKDYAPDEVPKLEKAVLRQSGEWVVLVVAADPTAASHTVGEYI